MRLILFNVCFFILIQQGLSQSSEVYDFSTHFAMEVHSVDDFFDRFNFNKKGNFYKYIVNRFPDNELDRKNLIVALFNYQNKLFNPDEIKKFIFQVTDSINPKFLKYNDKEWYAELKCKVIYKSKPSVLTLILKVNRSKNSGYSWDIVSAKADFLKLRPVKSDSLIMRNIKMINDSIQIRNSDYFLSPVSHGIEFTNIDNIFVNKSKINNYLYPGPRSFELLKLAGMISKSEIIFKQVDKIRYHLLQVDNWILVLDQFNRKEANSGWLINQLVQIDNREKSDYKLKQLNIPKM